MDTDKFEKDMAVFDFRQHQEVLTYLTYLNEKGWTIEDVKGWMDERKRILDENKEQAEREQKAYEEKMLKCPKCGSTMFIRPVNIDNKTQTGDSKDKSVWMCPDKECLYTIYNEKTVQEIVRI